MTYAEWQVAPDVVVWRSTDAGGETRVLPDGCLDVLLTDDGPLVAGPDTRARVVGGVGDVLGVRLHAGRGPQLLGVPADELRDRTLSLAAVWGDRRAQALAAMPRDPSVLARWTLIASDPSPLGRRLHVLLDSGHSIGGSAEAMGYSPRQLHRLAVPLFGYGLQHLGRVLRLGRAVALSDAGETWGEVAAAAGYADQAHLARDVRALSGTSPSGLRSERVRSVQDDPEPELVASSA